MKRIGFYPGTFDPLHDGHLAFVRAAVETCALDDVYFMPESKPSMKPHASPIEVRLREIAKAIEPFSHLHTLSGLATTFRVENTLAYLRHIDPAASRYMLVGSDTFLGMPSWDNIVELLLSFTIIVGQRDTQTIAEVQAAQLILGQIAPSPVHIIRTSKSHLSSTAIRQNKKGL